MNKKQEVSKGLRSLLSNIEKTHNNPLEKTRLVKDLSHTIAMIRPELIEVNPFQPRTEFDPEQLMDLAKSIKVSGLIQPVTVRSLGGDKFQLISGERRLRASKMAGLNEIPAYVRIANDQEMLEMALVENIQRADLNALEVAISYQRLMDECQLTHEALAERVGKDRSTVTNYVRLLKLPAPVQTAVRDGQLSMGHARALAGIVNPALQLSVFKECTDRSLSVRALEQLIKTYEQTPSREENVKKVQVTPMSPEIRKISDQMSHSLGTRVDIKRDGTGKGTITIHFSSDKTFNQVTDLLLTDD